MVFQGYNIKDAWLCFETRNFSVTIFARIHLLVTHSCFIAILNIQLKYVMNVNIWNLQWLLTSKIAKNYEISTRK